MYKRILTCFILLISIISCGCFGTSHEIKIDKSYTISAQEKAMLQKYILQTREIMRPYAYKLDEIDKSTREVIDNSSSVNGLNENSNKLWKEEIKTTEAMLRELKKVQIPNNCPTAERLALLREERNAMRIKILKESMDSNVVFSLIKKVSTFLSTDTSKLEKIEEEIDNIFSLADIKPE